MCDASNRPYEYANRYFALMSKYCKEFRELNKRAMTDEEYKEIEAKAREEAHALV